MIQFRTPCRVHRGWRRVPGIGRWSRAMNCRGGRRRDGNVDETGAWGCTKGISVVPTSGCVRVE